jgi:hypothetical protein
LPLPLCIFPTFSVFGVKTMSNCSLSPVSMPTPPSSHQRPTGIHGETPPEGSTSGLGIPVHG